MDLALAVWFSRQRGRIEAESSHLQTRILGQGSGTRSVDEQVRSDHDLSADGNAAGGYTVAHYAVCDRHLPDLYDKRLRRWKHGIPRHPDRRPRAPKNGRRLLQRAFDR